MLKFYYGCMHAGKTLHLINAKEIYDRKGMKTIIIKPKTDTRDPVTDDGYCMIHSRFAPEKKACASVFENLSELEKRIDKVDVVLIDEAQFMRTRDVEKLADIAQGKTVLAYGLKNDINGNLFEGARGLLAYADEISEIPTLCEAKDCERPAHFHARYVNGVREVDSYAVGIEKDNVIYKSLCYKHWKGEVDSVRKQKKEKASGIQWVDMGYERDGF